jgi:hypothetical protein
MIIAYFADAASPGGLATMPLGPAAASGGVDDPFLAAIAPAGPSDLPGAGRDPLPVVDHDHALGGEQVCDE